LYDISIKEFITKEKAKTEVLRQNVSKIRSQLDSETLQRSKLTQKCAQVENENTDLHSQLEFEKSNKDLTWVKKYFISKLRCDSVAQKLKGSEAQVSDLQLKISKLEAELEKLRFENDLCRKQLEENEQKHTDFLEKLDVENYGL
jgi:chromosome segregation ATPase